MSTPFPQARHKLRPSQKWSQVGSEKEGVIAHLNGDKSFKNRIVFVKQDAKYWPSLKAEALLAKWKFAKWLLSLILKIK